MKLEMNEEQKLPPPPQSFTAFSSDFIQRINIENAKLVALAFIVLIIAYHGSLHVLTGSDSCHWLLSDGRFQGTHIWQPYGCMLHTYSQRDVRYCMKYINYLGGHTRIIFVGDSRIRQLYEHTVHHIDPNTITGGEKHSDKLFEDQELNVQLEFKWVPEVNDSMYNLMSSYLKLSDNEKPGYIVVGSATWTIKERNATKQALKDYETNITRLASVFKDFKQTKTKVLWQLQDPVNSGQLGPSRANITNEQIDFYNKAAMKNLGRSVIVWKSSRLVAQGYNSDSPDGLHAGPVALKYDTQILLNMYCNERMNFNDGTCCASREPTTNLQIATAVAFGICALGSLLLCLCRSVNVRRVRMNGILPHSIASVKPAKPENNGDDMFIVVTCMFKLGLIMAYFFLCDRTNFFMKENKYYSHLNFFLPFGYVMALGLFFTEETKNTALLHRLVTDEWKGWMQLVILIYHMTGASQVLPIYMQIRCLVTAYLFLTGYNHFTYFWIKKDYGVFRVCKMLFRLNMEVILLCFVMNRPYQFYYFVPLVSFWFLVIYTFMFLPPQIGSASAETNPLHYLSMILKFVALTTVITVLYMSEILFEKIFVTRPWKALFITSDDSIREWLFRWQLDRYSVLYGMLFGFACYLMKKFEVLDDRGNYSLFSSGVSWIVSLLSILGLVSYTAFTFLCKNKPECNEVHAYVSFVPIISYIMLRNTAGFIRTRYSPFFAWFGRISLELFISQYHIWLAADTHGVLVLIPSYPVLNIIVTSFTFICIAHEIFTITGVLSNYVVPDDWKSLARNALLFLCVLIPVGTAHGMFKLG